MVKNLPLEKPQPNARRFIDALQGRIRSPLTPLVEYIIDDAILKPIVKEWLGRRWIPYPECGTGPPDRDAQKTVLDNIIEVWYRLGYDCVRFERGLPFPERTVPILDTASQAIKPRAWAEEHEGSIMT